MPLPAFAKAAPAGPALAEDAVVCVLDASDELSRMRLQEREEIGGRVDREQFRWSGSGLASTFTIVSRQDRFAVGGHVAKQSMQTAP